jgi:uncharacterized protein YjiS (DUF1127 family)
LSSIFAETRPQRGRALRDSALAIAQSILMLVRLWRARRRDRRQLAVMSERELQDMGTCRADIADEIGRPFWRDNKKGRLP